MRVLVILTTVPWRKIPSLIAATCIGAQEFTAGGFEALVLYDGDGTDSGPVAEFQQALSYRATKITFAYSESFGMRGSGPRWFIGARAASKGFDYVLHVDDDIVLAQGYIDEAVRQMRELEAKTGKPAVAQWVWRTSFNEHLELMGVSGGASCYNPKALAGLDEDEMRPWLDLNRKMSGDISMSAWLHRAGVKVYTLCGPPLSEPMKVGNDDPQRMSIVLKDRYAEQAREVRDYFGYVSPWLPKAV